MKSLSLLSLFIYMSNGALITPYTWIDFDYVRTNNDYTNNGSVRTQTASDGDVVMTSSPTSTTSDNSGATVGVYTCDAAGNKTIAAHLDPLTYDAFSLEVIVKIGSLDTIFNGYIIGIENTSDVIEGDAISFNAINGKTSGQSKKFFAANVIQNGWQATTTYWDSVATTDAIAVDTFYHVIISQDNAGLVRVFVNGAIYGSSYTSAGGAKPNARVFQSIFICGDASGHLGIDASIRAFGFYTTAFDNNADALDACSEAAMSDCNGITFVPTNTVPCILGTNYNLEGVPAYAHGDPHFRTFNGDYHDFMGRSGQQFYYMHPCKSVKRQDMPFAMLANHYQVGMIGVSSVDYITFELFDANGDIYYVWLSASIHSWSLKGTTTNSNYDANPGTNLVSNVQTSLGQRFKILYKQTSASRIDVILNILSCTVSLYMSGSRSINGRYRNHYVHVPVPSCYKCHTCGLFGQLQRPASFHAMRDCHGAYVRYQRGWTGAAQSNAFDITAWGWEKSYVATNCAQYWTRRRRRNLLQIDDPYICDPTTKSNVTSACQTARDAQSTCCTTIGGEFCDVLQADCEYDGCVFVSTDTTAIHDVVSGLLTEPIQLVCSLLTEPTSEPTATPTALTTATATAKTTTTALSTAEPTTETTTGSTTESSPDPTKKASITTTPSLYKISITTGIFCHTLNGLCSFCIMTSCLLLLIYRKKPVINKSRVSFMILILFGLELLSMSITHDLIASHEAGGCAIYIWLTVSGIFLILLSLCTKTWAIQKVIQYAKKRKLFMWNSLKLFLVFVLIPFIIMSIYFIIWTSYDKAMMSATLENGYCQYQVGFIMVPCIMCILSLILLSVLSYRSRNVPELHKETKYLVLTIFSFITIIVILPSLTLTQRRDTDLSWLLRSVFVAIFIQCILSFLFYIKFINIFYESKLAKSNEGGSDDKAKKSKLAQNKIGNNNIDDDGVVSDTMIELQQN